MALPVQGPAMAVVARAEAVAVLGSSSTGGQELDLQTSLEAAAQSRSWKAWEWELVVKAVPLVVVPCRNRRLRQIGRRCLRAVGAAE